jgi:RNA polymerase sigma factor (sigma-70 family)
VDLNKRLAADLDGAFEAFVLAHQDAVYGTALRLTSGGAADAEDVAQETFVRAYRALSSYEPGRIRELSARPWLARIALNVVRNRARQRGRRPQTVPLDGARAVVADPASGPEARAEQAAETARVASLPERYRTPLVLRHLYGLSYEEVAGVLDRPVGTVKAQVSRAIQQLKEQA